MDPYWQSASGDVTVYHARYEDVLAAGVVDVPRVALVHDDPPYGIGWDASGRIGRPSSVATSGGVYGREWGKIPGDERPFDPAAIVAMGRPSVLWGGNHYASRLPDSGGWIVWDKKRGATAGRGFTGSDCELAWTNIGDCVGMFSYFWDGFRRDGEVGSHLHPTQKPIALCSYVYQRAKLKPGDLVFVPHGGSGPDLPAARAAGLRLIWCDVEQWCCDTAIARLPDAPIAIVARAKEWQRRAAKMTPEKVAEPVGPLFGAR